MANFEISSGPIPSAQKIVIYGPEGIGKSTFAACFPESLFIDTEGSTKKLNVHRMPKPTSWEMLMQEVRHVVENPTICSTLVIDTIDWAEQLCIAHICAKSGKSGIEDFGYGKGYVYEKEAFAGLLHALDDVIAVGVNVLLTAHAQLRKVEQPEEMGGYDHWELKLGAKTTANIAPMVKEWADMLLFANYKTVVISTDEAGKKHKAQGGRRVMYTTHSPWWDAKNRDCLPDELDFAAAPILDLLIDREALRDPAAAEDAAYRNLGNAVNRSLEQPAPARREEQLQQLNDILDEAGLGPVTDEVDEELPKELADLMAADNVTAAQIRKAVAGMGYYPEDTPISAYDPEFVSGAIIGHWAELKQFINN